MSNKLDYWLTNDVLKKTVNSIIINVIIDINNKDITEDDIKELQENHWVIKFVECFDNEIKIINSMKLYNNNLCIKMPLKQKFRCRIENKYSYHVMEKYDSDLNEDPYIATCPINYNMYKVNNQYKCYKNCPEYSRSAEINTVDYNIDISGKQCLQKKFINK